MVPNCKTLHMCFFAISGNFVTRFSGKVFSQDCSGHSVKCNVWEKVSCWAMDQKAIDQLDCMIFPNIVSL